MTLEQLIERFPHLQLRDLRFLARLDGNNHDAFWQIIANDNNEETLVTHIQHCRELMKVDW